MDERLQATLYGVLLALAIGWVLLVGESIFVPIVFSIMVVYVIAGLSRLFLKLPLEGTRPIAILLSRNGQV